MKTLFLAIFVYISIVLASFLPDGQVVLNTLFKPSRPGSQSTLEHARESVHARDSFIEHWDLL